MKHRHDTIFFDSCSLMQVLRDLEVALRLTEAGEDEASPRRRSPVVTQPLATA